jgi:hypothetical protein
MNQKSSFREVPQFVSQVLKRSLTLGCSFAEDDLSGLAFAMPLGASDLSIEHPKEAALLVYDQTASIRQTIEPLIQRSCGLRRTGMQKQVCAVEFS